MSDLHSIFYSSQQLQSFIKLCSDEPLHQLHAEFWGKRVEDEAAEWWASPNPCIVTDRSLEAKTNKDPGDDEFEDDDESGDHEAPPGSNCYVLTIDTPLPIRRKILVRNEYAHIYDCFETRYDKSLAGDTTPITVLTGQPGIGELDRNKNIARHSHTRSRKKSLAHLCPLPASQRMQARPLVPDW